VTGDVIAQGPASRYATPNMPSRNTAPKKEKKDKGKKAGKKMGRQKYEIQEKKFTLYELRVKLDFKIRCQAK
jgi:hypothetical protein